MSPAEKVAAVKKPRLPRQNVNPTWECRLKQRRQKLGLSIHDVARGSKVSAPTISRLERGDDPILSNARKIADYFGVGVDELWPRLAKVK